MKFQMKKLIMFLLLFVPVSLIAQNNVEKDNPVMKSIKRMDGQNILGFGNAGPDCGYDD